MTRKNSSGFPGLPPWHGSSTCPSTVFHCNQLTASWKGPFQQLEHRPFTRSDSSSTMLGTCGDQIYQMPTIGPKARSWHPQVDIPDKIQNMMSTSLSAVACNWLWGMSGYKGPVESEHKHKRRKQAKSKDSPSWVLWINFILYSLELPRTPKHSVLSFWCCLPEACCSLPGDQVWAPSKHPEMLGLAKEAPAASKF